MIVCILTRREYRHWWSEPILIMMKIYVYNSRGGGLDHCLRIRRMWCLNPGRRSNEMIAARPICINRLRPLQTDGKFRFLSTWLHYRWRCCGYLFSFRTLQPRRLPFAWSESCCGFIQSLLPFALLFAKDELGPEGGQADHDYRYPSFNVQPKVHPCVIENAFGGPHGSYTYDSHEYHYWGEAKKDSNRDLLS